MEGKFITIYGVNNMGKSTHAKLLVKRLKAQGHKAYYVKYPVYELEPSGTFINDVLRSGDQRISENELQLWFVLNRYQYQPELKRMLEEGYIIVAEDYIGTGMAWGMAKGLSEEWVERCNEGLLTEDLAILVEGERIKEATEENHVHEENHELVEKCSGKFSYLADKHNWQRVELQRRKEDTANLIWSKVSEFLVY